MCEGSRSPWQLPRPFNEETARREALEKFDEDPSGDRQHYLVLIGLYLDMRHPRNIKAVGELRRIVKEDGRVFPTNAGSYTRLIPIVRGVMKQGIDFFAKKKQKSEDRKENIENPLRGSPRKETQRRVYKLHRGHSRSQPDENQADNKGNITRNEGFRGD